ncbi:signal peptidase I [Treponema parvum]|uniref:Signal peptidase I n=1 Tax=Treponema parvum TaxID=138851 RepID=A0A975IEA6_9SPIR|nr:signal peptidase I [Treponema parvum]QTQ13632.1 signal peptidase I [Treponema parvum]
MNKIRILNLCAVFTALVFSILNINFHVDISFFAFPLSVLFAFARSYFSFVLFKKNDMRLIPVVRKFIQYEPYVFMAVFILRRAGEHETSYLLDLVCVIFWLCIAVCSFALQYYMSEKRVYSYNSLWESARKDIVKPKRSFAFRALTEAAEWIDALLQAVFMVLLIQIFFFQLYQIPSESMVPEFLIKDRVVVGKTASGPKFPLSEIGLPYLKTYRRGNIVVFRNPHYIIDRKSEIKTFVSQLVYMLSFTTVNLNVDEKGDPKADPLVKRVAGVPGEQLVMQDGILYARTKDSADFKQVEYDAEKAAWDLNSLPEKIKRNISYFPLTSEEYELMIECERQRNSLDLLVSAQECKDIAASFERLSRRTVKDQSAKQNSLKDLFTASDMFEYNLFDQNISVTQKLLSASGGSEWFTLFMTDWIARSELKSGYIGGDIYTDASFRLNIMIKLTLGRIILRNAELMFSNKTAGEKNSDEKRLSYFKTAQMLHFYILLHDRRNMPVFPANDASGKAQYIPENCYFMMGDNRFNSLDMRHSYNEKLVRLTDFDDFSVTYYSNMSPQYVNRRYILGTTALRFWPPGRIGRL